MKVISTIFVFLVSLGAFAQTLETSDKLVSLYTLNGNALDYSGNGRHCTNVGAVLAEGVDGQPNSCYDFTNGYLEYTDSFPMPDSVLTFSAWVKPDGNNFMPKIFSTPDGSLSFEIWDFGMTTGAFFSPRCTLKTSLESYHLNIGGGYGDPVEGVSRNEWFHYYVEFDHDTASIYINNELYQRTVSQENFISESIAYNGIKIGDDFEGKIDEIYLVADVLPPSQRTELYEYGISQITSSKTLELNTSINYNSQFIEFLFKEKINGGYKILNINGQNITEGELPGNSSKLAIDKVNMSPGIYFLALDNYPDSQTKFIVK